MHQQSECINNAAALHRYITHARAMSPRDEALPKLKHCPLFSALFQTYCQTILAEGNPCFFPMRDETLSTFGVSCL